MSDDAKTNSKSLDSNKKYLNDVYNFIKLNYKCPKGTVDDSNRCPETEEENVSSKSQAPKTYNRIDPNRTYENINKGKRIVTVKDIDSNFAKKLDKCAENLNKLNESEQDAIFEYTGEGYYDINKYLLGDLRRDEQLYADDQLESIIQKLDSSMDKSKLPEDLVVYHGIDFYKLKSRPDLKKQFDTDGAIFKSDTFMSASALPFIAEEFASNRIYGKNEEPKPGILLEIRVPKNSRALYIESLSENKEEAELLIDRGSKFKVVDRKVSSVSSPNSSRPPTKVDTVVLELLPKK